MTAFYDAFKEKLLSQTDAIDFDTDTIKIRLVTGSTYSEVLATDDFLDDVTAYAGTTDQTLTTKTVTDGVFDCSDTLTYTSVAQQSTYIIDGAVLYKDTGTPSTSPLIAFYDQFTSITPDGSSIDLTFNASGLFAI